MKKSLTLFLTFVFTLSLHAATSYYVAGNGTTGNPWCGGKSWNPAGSLLDENGSITFKNVPAGSYAFKITTGSWSTNYGYNNLDDACTNLETYPEGDGNICFVTTVVHNITITFNATSKKICLTGDGKEPPIDSTKIAAVGVPAECEDVMLQGFYWNSHSKNTYGGKNTRWSSLMADTADICHDFDLIWLPPATGGSGVGYYASSYSFKTSSAWGTKQQLCDLIAALNRGGTKALADIVINHRNSSNGWAKAFREDDFGGYGKFQLTSEHICAGDEAFSDAKSDSKTLPHGAADTGNNDAGCRDLDHTNEYVQNLCKAYTRYMLDSIGFSGFRYDMVIGYGANYLSEYNLNAKPYISVGEYWSSLAATVSYVKAAKYNTMVFDFPLKYTIKNSIGKGTFTSLKGTASNSLRGKGLGKYAVTFVDNHDTYDRDNTDYLVKDIRANATSVQRVLQANAYILSMPGIPCVFYPHWACFKKDISQMIQIRRAAGIHSESEVLSETAASKNYEATIVGHNGNIILRMGADRSNTLPVGYTLLYAGPDVDIYLSTECVGDLELLTPIQNTMVEEAPAGKILRNGQLLIERDGRYYDVLGRTL